MQRLSPLPKSLKSLLAKSSSLASLSPLLSSRSQEMSKPRPTSPLHTMTSSPMLSRDYTGIKFSGETIRCVNTSKKSVGNIGGLKSGEIVVTNSTNTNVIVYSPDGVLQSEIECKWNGERGGFVGKTGKGVVDNKIVSFAPLGSSWMNELKTTAQTKLTDPSPLTHPEDLEDDPDNPFKDAAVPYKIPSLPPPSITINKPDIVACDKTNNRIRIIPFNKSSPPLEFGGYGSKVGEFLNPVDVSFHHNFSEWEIAKTYNPASDYNTPPWYLINETKASASFLISEAKAGAFNVIHDTKKTFILNHVTKESYINNEVENKTITSSKNKFYIDSDDRGENNSPKQYDSLQGLIEDAEYLELNLDVISKESRRYAKIAVCDLGNDRVQVVGYIKSTNDDQCGILFPPKFKVLQVLGNLKAPNSCTYNSYGDLVVSDSGNKRVCIFAFDGELVHTIETGLEKVFPISVSFGYDNNGNGTNVLIGYNKGCNCYSIPPRQIEGDVALLPRSAVLRVFEFMDFHAAADASTSCKLFLSMFNYMKERWLLYPLRPCILMRLKQLFVDWSVIPQGCRIKGHLATRDPYKSEVEMGTDIEWWIDNYSEEAKKNRGEEKVSHLALLVEGEKLKAKKKKEEARRARNGGQVEVPCKYKKEDLNSDFVINIGQLEDLFEVVKAMELTFVLENDWRWQMLLDDKTTEPILLTRRKEKFLRKIVIEYLKPPVNEDVINASGASIEFDGGIRCAVSTVCGLPFWWNCQNQLRVLFNYMAASAKNKKMDYHQFLTFMTIVSEKQMGLRNWTGNAAFKTGVVVPKSKEAEVLPSMRKNAIFDDAVDNVIGMVDKIFNNKKKENDKMLTRLPKLV